ncbi:IS1380 family transposase [Halosquirtibacter xylanolyticus]|uniref:IS1380 family transposase n=1 Tax=Halosquirtibacter xylanolyticus TaxID=3374599 RepID=UPI00374867A5|nr:IS1380 family transposase [Prolixibacteraceae bacterium]QZT36267.1 IS1380 family transposase [Prolixibacteraceae bacterium]QZT37583.1 IS1380 family transposase [Prolixibacteraceae bacterium]
MIKDFNSKVTPFGGIYLIHDLLISNGIIQFINEQLVDRDPKCIYKFSDLLLPRVYTTFCGGSATEDINYLRDNTLNNLRSISIPSADTILRGDVELSTPCEIIEGKTTIKGQKINVNTLMNKFLLASAIKFKQLDPNASDLIYDFDHQFIPTQKSDAEYSYKKTEGYFPGVATIGNIPVYIEGRNGNCHVKTAQLETHKRALELLASKGVKLRYARMDCGSYIKEVTDYFHQEGILFSIRASHSNVLLSKASKTDNWSCCEINNQAYEVNSFKYEFGQYTHRIIAYRKPNKSNQMSLITNDAKSYQFIVTNDWDITEEQAIIFYNQRGASEKVFDIQNNDFNWKSMPHSNLEENTVYLIIMAVAHILYRYIISKFADLVDGLKTTSRLKAFIFRFVTVAAKITKSGRRVIVHLATNNKKLIKSTKTG